MRGGATQDVNPRDSEEMPKFQRRSGPRATVLSRAIRVSELLTCGGARSTAVAVRDDIERSHRLVLEALHVTVASKAMMSEWRRRVGLKDSILNDSKMRMPLARARRHDRRIWLPTTCAPVAAYVQPRGARPSDEYPRSVRHKFG
jgi:hypothetical protein